MIFFSYIMYFHLLTCMNMALIGLNKELLEMVHKGENYHNNYVIWTQNQVRHTIDFSEGYLMLLRETTYLATFTYVDDVLGESLPKWYLILVWSTSKLVFTYFIGIKYFCTGDLEAKHLCFVCSSSNGDSSGVQIVIEKIL